MIKKLDKHLAHNINSCNMSQNIMVAHKAIEKINELVDAVNGILDYAPLEMAMKAEPAENVQPDYVTTTYMTDGHTKEYYGQNGASIVTDHPLPAGYLIIIREPEIKGGDNE